MSRGRLRRRAHHGDDRGQNLHFRTDVEGAIRSGDVIFVCVGTPTKTYGVGAGRAADLRYIESAARMIAEGSSGSLPSKGRPVPAGSSRP